MATCCRSGRVDSHRQTTEALANAQAKVAVVAVVAPENVIEQLPALVAPLAVASAHMAAGLAFAPDCKLVSGLAAYLRRRRSRRRRPVTVGGVGDGDRAFGCGHGANRFGMSELG